MSQYQKQIARIPQMPQPHLYPLLFLFSKVHTYFAACHHPAFDKRKVTRPPMYTLATASTALSTAASCSGQSYYRLLACRAHYFVF